MQAGRLQGVQALSRHEEVRRSGEDEASLRVEEVHEPQIAEEEPQQGEV